MPLPPATRPECSIGCDALRSPLLERNQHSPDSVENCWVKHVGCPPHNHGKSLKVLHAPAVPANAPSTADSTAFDHTATKEGQHC
jgi:hypothetical protein